MCGVLIGREEKFGRVGRGCDVSWCRAHGRLGAMYGYRGGARVQGRYVWRRARMEWADLKSDFRLILSSLL